MSNISTAVPPLLTTDPCSFFSLLLPVTILVCAQETQETQAKSFITLDRCYFADLFALLTFNFLSIMPFFLYFEGQGVAVQGPLVFYTSVMDNSCKC